MCRLCPTLGIQLSVHGKSLRLPSYEPQRAADGTRSHWTTESRGPEIDGSGGRTHCRCLGQTSPERRGPKARNLDSLCEADTLPREKSGRITKTPALPAPRHTSTKAAIDAGPVSAGAVRGTVRRGRTIRRRAGPRSEVAEDCSCAMPRRPPGS